MTNLSSNVISGGVSGLMGMAWPALAQSGGTPWWLTLAGANPAVWASPLFAFSLARFSNDASATNNESNGGEIDLGFLNTDLYTGDINWVSLTSENYWLIPLDGITIGGKTTTPGGQAAIDTGTSLIGGPTASMAALYAQIPGAEPGTGDLEGYYVYPCSTNVSVSLTFGGQSYSIESTDFSRAADNEGIQCTGAFFPLDIGNGVVEWIVGDAFMKNVYTAFRASPSAVGFATRGSGGNGNSTTTTNGGNPSTTSPSKSGAAAGLVKPFSSMTSLVVGATAVMTAVIFGAAI